MILILKPYFMSVISRVPHFMGFYTELYLSHMLSHVSLVILCMGRKCLSLGAAIT